MKQRPIHVPNPLPLWLKVASIFAIGEPFRFPTRDIGCTVSAMVYGLSMIQKVLTDTGLSDLEIFEAMRFESVDDLQGALFPEGKVDLTTWPIEIHSKPPGPTVMGPGSPTGVDWGTPPGQGVRATGGGGWPPERVVTQSHHRLMVLSEGLSVMGLSQ